MERAIKYSAVFCMVWSVVAAGVLLWLNLVIRAMLRGQMFGGGADGWGVFFACCFGIEAVNLAALWGAARLRAWARVVLTGLLAACAVTLLFLTPDTRDKALFGPLLWLSPSVLPTLVLWRHRRCLRRGL